MQVMSNPSGIIASPPQGGVEIQTKRAKDWIATLLTLLAIDGREHSLILACHHTGAKYTIMQEGLENIHKILDSLV